MNNATYELNFLCETLCLLCGSLCNKKISQSFTEKTQRTTELIIVSFDIISFLSRVRLQLIGNPVVL